MIPIEYDKSKYDSYGKISMTSAAKLQSARTGSVEEVNTICNCKGLCKGDNRCKCFKLGKKCTSHCHLKLKGNCKNC